MLRKKPKTGWRLVDQHSSTVTGMGFLSRQAFEHLKLSKSREQWRGQNTGCTGARKRQGE